MHFSLAQVKVQVFKCKCCQTLYRCHHIRCRTTPLNEKKYSKQSSPVLYEGFYLCMLSIRVPFGRIRLAASAWREIQWCWENLVEPPWGARGSPSSQMIIFSLLQLLQEGNDLRASLTSSMSFLLLRPLRINCFSMTLALAAYESAISLCNAANTHDSWQECCFIHWTVLQRSRF